MGREAVCTVRLGTQVSEGKALLETSELIFRGSELRLAIPFRDMTAVEGTDGLLRVKFGVEMAEFQLGPKASKWAHAILNPKTRLDKLGVKEGLAVCITGDAPADFLSELGARGVRIVKKDPDLRFLFASDLAALKKLPSGGPLWIVYPKGQKAITQADVMKAGRDAGLVEIKVASFSDSHTALKFTPPSKR